MDKAILKETLDRIKLVSVEKEKLKSICEEISFMGKNCVTVQSDFFCKISDLFSEMNVINVSSIEFFEIYGVYGDTRYYTHINSAQLNKLLNRYRGEA